MVQERTVIPAAEFTSRVAACQKKLRELGWSGLVLSEGGNINYYIGFRVPNPWTSYTRPMYLFLPAEGTPIFYTNVFLTEDAKVKAPTISHRSFRSTYGPTIQEMEALMEEVGMTNGIVGFEIGHEQRIDYQVSTYLALTQHLKNVTPADASMLLWELRLIKSPNELACIRRANNALKYAFDRIFEQVCEGMDGYEIESIVRRSIIEGGADKDGFIVLTYGSGNYNRTGTIRTDRKLKYGDMLWLDIGCECEGYWADLCRAGIVGPISDERRKCQQDIFEATMEASGSISPGKSFKEVAEACGDALNKRGYFGSHDVGRFGHGIGLTQTEPPSIATFEAGFLKEGMVINIEPAIVKEHGVYCTEESFVVTQNGCERLSSCQPELYQIRTVDG